MTLLSAKRRASMRAPSAGSGARSWILRRDDRGRRSVGPGVIEAFYAGYDTIDPTQFDYLCKLDLDLEIPPRYFELLMQRMEGEPRLGTCSGQLYYRGRNGRLVSEACGHETSIGPSKF